jgi:hypothetical protein
MGPAGGGFGRRSGNFRVRLRLVAPPLGSFTAFKSRDDFFILFPRLLWLKATGTQEAAQRI